MRKVIAETIMLIDEGLRTGDISDSYGRAIKVKLAKSLAKQTEEESLQHFLELNSITEHDIRN